MIDQKIYDDAPLYCKSYFDLVESNDLLSELEKSKTFTEEILDQITPPLENYAYAPSKWTVKEVLRHIIDCERILCYRALRFSRLDNTELPGFDEDLYIDNMKGIDTEWNDMCEEYRAVRAATISLYKPMQAASLDFKGIANKHTYTARSLGFMIVGHNLHHGHILMERYF